MFPFDVSCMEYKIHAAFTLCREICGYSAILKIKPELVQYRYIQPVNTSETYNFGLAGEKFTPI